MGLLIFRLPNHSFLKVPANDPNGDRPTDVCPLTDSREKMAIARNAAPSDTSAFSGAGQMPQPRPLNLECSR